MISAEDKKRIKKMFFVCGYGIDQIVNYYKGKYERAEIRGYIFRVIGD